MALGFRVAVSKPISRFAFLSESPPNPKRGLESTRLLSQAKRDFVDQTDVDNYVEARGGTAGQWVIIDLTVATGLG